MGKRSVKENKNIYQLYRERLDLTREKASDLMPGISSDRIEKIESGKSLPHPDEILIMARGYKAPELCNQFCVRECPIGQSSMKETPKKALSQITLDVLNSLNRLNREKSRLIEITVDGKISEDEFRDFIQIQNQLNEISQAVSSLQLWLDQMIADGEIDKAKLAKVRKQMEEERGIPD